ncbi:MAG: Minichromosome maintenance protein MCM, partial [Desulfurococcaceae archaeon]
MEEAKPEYGEMREAYVNLFMKFLETFKSKEGFVKYYDRIWQMIRMGQKSVIIDFDDLIQFDKKLAEKVLDNP